MFERHHLQTLIKRMQEPGRFLQVIMGPRQVGKTTFRQRSSSPKFQVHNTALISAQRNDLSKDTLAKPDEWGRMVESAIGAHLINHSLTEKFNLHYRRDRNEEVDFVIERKGKVIGLEVKSGATGSTSGMTAFKNKFNPDKFYLLEMQDCHGRISLN